MNPYKNRDDVLRKTFENLCRRQASRLGLKLTRSRVRLVNVNNLGGYRITDAETEEVLAGVKYELDINQAKAWLDQYEAKILAERQ